jgi:hypothetical protein
MLIVVASFRVRPIDVYAAARTYYVIWEVLTIWSSSVSRDSFRDYRKTRHLNFISTAQNAELHFLFQFPAY